MLHRFELTAVAATVCHVMVVGLMQFNLVPEYGGNPARNPVCSFLDVLMMAVVRSEMFRVPHFELVPFLAGLKLTCLVDS